MSKKRSQRYICPPVTERLYICSEYIHIFRIIFFGSVFFSRDNSRSYRLQGPE